MKADSIVFYSNDITKSIPFYKDTIGLILEYKQERYVSFLFENGVRLGIKNQSEEREQPGFQTVFIAVNENIEELYNKITAKVKPYTTLSDKPWGKEFSVLDPDENKVLFIQRT